MKTDKLKPCPFCGCKHVRKVVSPVMNITMFVCPSCGADVCFYGAEKEPLATMAWNKRRN